MIEIKLHPEIVVKNGRPSAVILDIHEYQKTLERLEDLDDLRYLQKVRKQGTKFKKLEEYLKDFWSHGRMDSGPHPGKEDPRHKNRPLAS